MQTIGLFSPGEMGSAIARVLVEHGLTVASCLAGRSEQTRTRARQASIFDLPTVNDVVRAADLVLSITVPDAALEVGQAVAGAIANTRKAIPFVDANAISPMTARKIADVIESAGGKFVDAGIIGGTNRPMFYAAGTAAPEFARLKDYGLKIEVMGEEIGQASAFKMLYAGMTKGLSALAIELLVAAEAYGCLDALWDKYCESMPGVASTIERILPGVPFRAARRSQEMFELAEMMRAANLSSHMPEASGEVLRAVGEKKIASRYSPDAEKNWTARDVAKILRSD